MKKILLFIVCLIFSISCSSVKINSAGKTIDIKSNIKEKVSLIKNSFKQSKGGIHIKEKNHLEIVFYDEELKSNNFNLSFYNSDRYNKDEYLSTFDTHKKMNSFTYNNYDIEIFNLSSKHPHFEEFEKNFKYILIKKKSNDVEIVLESFSDFKDNVSEKFLIEKINQLEFSIK